MNNLNSILIEGNMVRDPLFRATPKGTPVCTFSVASNRFYKQDSGMEKETSFFDVETWSRLAENCSNLGRKGRGVRIVGRLRQERWAGNDGKPHSKVMIVAEHVEFRPEFRKDGATAGQADPTEDDSRTDDAALADATLFEDEAAEAAAAARMVPAPVF